MWVLVAEIVTFPALHMQMTVSFHTFFQFKTFVSSKTLLSKQINICIIPESSYKICFKCHSRLSPATCDTPHVRESTSLTPSSHLLSPSSKASHLTGSPSLFPSSHLHLGLPLLSAKHLQVAEKTASVKLSQEATSLKQPHLQVHLHKKQKY